MGPLNFLNKIEELLYPRTFRSFELKINFFGVDFIFATWFCLGNVSLVV
jgi:hypothetical protein